MIVSIIVAMSENRVIGRDNRLPWHISEDLKRFKRITTGHAVIMGRKTYESIGQLLPNRTNIIMTRDRKYEREGAVVVHSFDEAIRRSKGDEVFVIGGEEIYRRAIQRADRIYLTLIHDELIGDAYFPEFQPTDYTVTEQKRFAEPLPHTFMVLTRKRPRISRSRLRRR
ncbi:MAG: dihydrofolate reductase [Elusimicrobiota bacterium]